MQLFVIDVLCRQYKFVADGFDWFFDPSLPNSRDQSGNINNVLTLGTVPPTAADGPLLDARQWAEGLALPGIMEARKVLNETHQRLSIEGYTEIDVEHRGDNVLIITRHNAKTHRMCIFFVYTSFTPSAILNPLRCPISYDIKGKLDEVILEARLIIPQEASFVDATDHINGLPSRLLMTSHSKEIKSNFEMFDSRYDDRADITTLRLTSFLPGSVLVVLTQGYPHVHSHVANAVQDIESITDGLPGAKISRSEELLAYSYLLYSCDNEEKDRSRGTRGCYGLE